MLDLHPLLPRYKQFRKYGDQMALRMSQMLTTEMFLESATRLGMTKDGELQTENQNEMTVIVEHGLFDVRRNGRNLVETFIEALSLRDGSDQEIVARGMLNARHSVHVIEEIQLGAGVCLRDEFDGAGYDVTEISFSQSMKRGDRIALRLLPLDGFWMSSGVALPVRSQVFSRIVTKVKKNFPEGVVAARGDLDRRSSLNAMVIGTCLSAGAAFQVQYNNIEELSASRRQPTRLPGVDAPERHKVGRNELCPCGSGVKYKKCCGRVGRGSMLGHA